MGNQDLIEYMFFNPDLKERGWIGPGWYHWDEIACDVIGPFESAKAANEALERYIDHLNDG
jgi:hypothetical protein